ncbi:MAG: hypothetical protein U1E95_01795 [Rubrivivax sp.]
MGLHTLAHGSTADLFGSVSDENVARIRRQNSRRISVIIGNLPYNANQANENDNNKNRGYPAIDQRIKQSYIAESIAAEDQALRHVCALLPLGQRPADANGVLAFVYQPQLHRQPHLRRLPQDGGSRARRGARGRPGRRRACESTLKRHEAQRVRHPDRRGHQGFFVKKAGAQ